jgi:hypothetical protein
MYKLSVKNKYYSYEKIGTYKELIHLLEDFYVSICEITIEEYKK